MVLARDEESGEVACHTVIDPYENPERSIILLELADPDGHVDVIEPRGIGAGVGDREL